VHRERSHPCDRRSEGPVATGARSRSALSSVCSVPSVVNVMGGMKTLLLTGALLCAAPQTFAFGLEDVTQRARALAQKPYAPPDEKLPKALAELNYDQYRDIRFKPAQALWKRDELPFEVQFFHPGFFYKQPVRIHVIDRQGVRDLQFRPDWFDYGKNSAIEPESLLETGGYAGFRVHYPVNRRDYKDELLVFLGASYFRAVGKGQHYGLSARGLAVDTALASGEEFPAFTDFWLERPSPEDKHLVIYALLDSRRVTAAYRFEVRSGESTLIGVQARIFQREPVGKLGVAPLTSMYHFGENDPSPREDYRPEVHDSDGLMVQLEREWLWRPLQNPRRLLVTSFAAVNPRGFGLMQRDRNFSHYEDLEARYEVRPSAWITPSGNWGPGRIELVQIPTPDETNDNIVAYWVPDQQPTREQPLTVAYTISWQMKNETRPPLAYVVQSRRGHGHLNEEDESIRYHIDFAGGALAKLKPEEISATVWAGDNGRVLDWQVYPNTVSGGWRVSMRVERDDEDKPMELRCLLRTPERVVSETWSYVLPPGERP
jgi:periplasmic glucans biosynthesis protein